ncbi:MAG: hypothetical protein WC788_02285 [Candidatus Paceibacterota bacterium]|jgi:hypothetical protein
MRSVKSVFEDYAKIDGFLNGIVKRLEKNNPDLADMIASEMEHEKEENAKERIFEMMLLASEVMGLTDPEDPDFVIILPNKKLKKHKSTITEIRPEYFSELMPPIYKLNDDTNKKGASKGLPEVPFPNIWNKILKIAITASDSRKHNLSQNRK